MSKIKKFPTNLFKKADATALEVDADMTPDDLRNIALQYRDDLIDELARLDAFIDWARCTES